MNGDDLVRFEEDNAEALTEAFMRKHEDDYHKFVEEQYIEREADQADIQYELDREQRTEQ